MFDPAPAPLTPRQERFCREFVLSANGSNAAFHAGYAAKSCRKQGYRLLHEPRIRARIQVLQAEMAFDNASERLVLLGKLEAVYRRAVQDGQYYAAARAVEMQARIAGLDAGRHHQVKDRDRQKAMEAVSGEGDSAPLHPASHPASGHPPAQPPLLAAGDSALGGRFSKDGPLLTPADWGHGENMAEYIDDPRVLNTARPGNPE